MAFRVTRVDTNVGISFIVSAVIHVAVFLLLTWWGWLFPVRLSTQETYYVDVVSLPTAIPASGDTAPKSETTEPAQLPAPLPQMKIPSPVRAAVQKNVKPMKTVKPVVSGSPAETESEFAERMAKLEHNSEARHEEAVLEKLRNKLKSAGTAKSGSSSAASTESGSHYADYIKSRLEDALKVTSSYTTKNPEVAVRLTIASDGRLTRMRIERSSGDAAFELAVRRAIDLASDKFTAPPNRAVFENGFVFKRQGISSGTFR